MRPGRTHIHAEPVTVGSQRRRGRTVSQMPSIAAASPSLFPKCTCSESNDSLLGGCVAKLPRTRVVVSKIATGLIISARHSQSGE